MTANDLWRDVNRSNISNGSAIDAEEAQRRHYRVRLDYFRWRASRHYEEMSPRGLYLVARAIRCMEEDSR